METILLPGCELREGENAIIVHGDDMKGAQPGDRLQVCEHPAQEPKALVEVTQVSVVRFMAITEDAMRRTPRSDTRNFRNLLAFMLSGDPAFNPLGNVRIVYVREVDQD